MILHNTDMKIPISNTLYGKKNYVPNIKKINSKILNNLNFSDVDEKRFPSIKLIEKCLTKGPLTPTIVNAANEVLVNLFLLNQIKLSDIVVIINKIFKDKNFKNYARSKPRTLKDIQIADNWARLKTMSMCVR